MRTSDRVAAALAMAAVATVALLAGGCSPEPTTKTPPRPAVEPPPTGGAFDYQITEGYPPADGVRVVARDRRDRPAPGAYSICYVNAFQAQPDELAWWRRNHPDLLLRDEQGSLVIDRDWDEALLDLSTAAKRGRVATVVGGWTDGCARDGFQAVEFDNLDSYSRSGGRLTQEHAADMARLLVRRAHLRGLAAAQKNTVELLDRRSRIGFDFAVVEDCARYRECGAYLDAYPGRVLDVEYRTVDFRRACDTWGERLAVVQRDLAVSTPGDPGYVHRSC